MNFVSQRPIHLLKASYTLNGCVVKKKIQNRFGIDFLLEVLGRDVVKELYVVFVFDKGIGGNGQTQTDRLGFHRTAVSGGNDVSVRNMQPIRS